jgi:hypothetical protein
MNITELSNYFKAMAVAHKLVRHTDNEKHFFRDHTEAIELLRDAFNCPAVIMGPPDFTPYERHRDNQQETTGISLIIVTQVSVNDTDQKQSAMDTCKQIANDFVSRMIRDEQNQDPIIAFEPDNCVIDPVGPILDNFYGVSLDITFNTILSLDYNSDNWLD